MKTLELIKLNESGANNVVASLQQLLADFQVYYTNLRGFHWNIKGHDFFVLHSQFEKMYDDTAEKVDESTDNTTSEKEVVIEGSEFQTIDEGLTLEKKIDVEIDNKVDLDKNNQ